jgi:hypothetical protein
MKKIWLILILITSALYADENRAYINITSNADKTIIFLDGKNIGETPIKQYEVTPNKSIRLEATVDKNYYKRDIKTTIKVNNNTIPTFSLKFEKAAAKIFFVGEDAELYINDKFIKSLKRTNRMVTLEADENIKINLVDGYSRAEMYKDIKANTLNTLEYELITIPKEVRLYTSTVNDLMWEDTKEAANTNINWEKGYTYCTNLKIAQYEDFRMPTINELQELYENKDAIYNGFGGKFYWSDSTFDGDKKIWNYSIVKNFEDGTNQKSIKEFDQGRVRCVRDI